MYLNVTSLCKCSQTLTTRVSARVTSCFPAVKLRVFDNIPLCALLAKDSLPYSQSRFVVYKLKCQCEADYVVRDNQLLESRNEQHTSVNIRRDFTSRSTGLTQKVCDSAKGKHVIDNPSFAVKYTIQQLLFYAEQDQSNTCVYCWYCI